MESYIQNFHVVFLRAYHIYTDKYYFYAVINLWFINIVSNYIVVVVSQRSGRGRYSRCLPASRTLDSLHELACDRPANNSPSMSSSGYGWYCSQIIMLINQGFAGSSVLDSRLESELSDVTLWFITINAPQNALTSLWNFLNTVRLIESLQKHSL